jgi:uncharacterized coiled-coil DUF342 family protein
MKTTSKQIEIELNRTTNRLDELTEMRGGINTKLQILQQGFIDGKTSLDELQAEQSKLTTLESSIKALEAKQIELHDDFQKASLSETRQTLLEKAKATATEAETFHHEFIEIRNKFHDSVCDYAEKTVEKMSAWRGKQRDFGRIANETQLTFQELERLGLTAESYKAATAEHINPPQLEYADALGAAVNILIRKIDRADEAERTAKFNKERAANQEKIKVQIDAENNKPKLLPMTFEQQ